MQNVMRSPTLKLHGAWHCKRGIADCKRGFHFGAHCRLQCQSVRLAGNHAAKCKPGVASGRLCPLRLQCGLELASQPANLAGIDRQNAKSARFAGAKCKWGRIFRFAALLLTNFRPVALAWRLLHQIERLTDLSWHDCCSAVSS